MSKFLISLFLLISFLEAAKKSNWTHEYTYSLKKDEIAHVSISTAVSKGEDKSNLFFRWTSIVGDRVTVLLNHKGHPYQHILYKKRSLDRVKIYLLPHGSDKMGERSYLFLVLSDINQGEKIVDFDIFIKDDKKRILVEF
jgi:hypothetical protein